MKRSCSSMFPAAVSFFFIPQLLFPLLFFKICFDFYLFFNSFGYAHNTPKFSGPGSNPSPGRDNAGSLTT